MQKQFYLSPELAVIEFGQEMLLCASPEVENSSITDLGESDWSGTITWK